MAVEDVVGRTEERVCVSLLPEKLALYVLFSASNRRLSQTGRSGLSRLARPLSAVSSRALTSLPQSWTPALGELVLKDLRWPERSRYAKREPLLSSLLVTLFKYPVCEDKCELRSGRSNGETGICVVPCTTRP